MALGVIQYIFHISYQRLLNNAQISRNIEGTIADLKFRICAYKRKKTTSPISTIVILLERN